MPLNPLCSLPGASGLLLASSLLQQRQSHLGSHLFFLALILSTLKSRCPSYWLWPTTLLLLLFHHSDVLHYRTLSATDLELHYPSPNSDHTNISSLVRSGLKWKTCSDYERSHDRRDHFHSSHALHSLDAAFISNDVCGCSTMKAFMIQSNE